MLITDTPKKKLKVTICTAVKGWGMIRLLEKFVGDPLVKH